VIPTEEDEWMMDDSFGLSIEYFIEFFIGLFWSLGIDDSETIHHSMDMCINSDVWHIIEHREDYLGRLDSDTREGLDEF
jgi:hypothetical protein